MVSSSDNMPRVSCTEGHWIFVQGISDGDLEQENRQGHFSSQMQWFADEEKMNDQEIRELIEHGFIVPMGDEVEVDIDLLRLLRTFGPAKAESFGNSLNVFLANLDSQGWDVKQGYSGHSLRTVLKKVSGARYSMQAEMVWAYHGMKSPYVQELLDSWCKSKYVLIEDNTNKRGFVAHTMGSCAILLTKVVDVVA